MEGLVPSRASHVEHTFRKSLTSIKCSDSKCRFNDPFITDQSADMYALLHGAAGHLMKLGIGKNSVRVPSTVNVGW